MLPFIPLKVPIIGQIGMFHAYEGSADIIRKTSKNGIMRLTRGAETNIVVSDAELIKEITLRNAKDYPKPEW